MLHLSDTHQFLTAAHFSMLPDADILLHTGDFTNRGQPEEYRNFDLVLAAVAHRYPVRLVVVGNHDCYTFEDHFKVMRELLPHATHVLFHEEYHHYHPDCAEVPIRFYGLPWYYGHHWDYHPRTDRGVLRDSGPRFTDIPPKTDVLLSHGPARHFRDEADGVAGFNSGSSELLQMIQAINPAIHAFGHIHEMHGLAAAHPTTGLRTLFVNSALASRWGKFQLINSPHSIVARFDDARRAWDFVVHPLSPIQWHDDQ
jgi:Icc-related predicted phosphoesterase